tara:strand:- start:1411 stop:1875 length:465 start_codon:yes stop_codon:yes gene_type:complete
MKKYIYIFIFIFIPFLLLSCDYSPIYSKKNNYNFKIEKIEFNGDAEINNLIDKKLKKYTKKGSDKKFDIFASSSYKKISQSKNLSGKTTNYLITIETNFEIKKEDKIKTLIFKEEFLIKNFSNKFEENNFEKIKKENAIDLVINKLVVQLSQMR